MQLVKNGLHLAKSEKPFNICIPKPPHLPDGVIYLSQFPRRVSVESSLEGDVSLEK